MEENEFLDQSWLYNKRLQALQAEDPDYKPEDPDYFSNNQYLSEDELAEKKVEIYVRNEQFQVRLRRAKSSSHACKCALLTITFYPYFGLLITV